MSDTRHYLPDYMAQYTECGLEAWSQPGNVANYNLKYNIDNVTCERCIESYKGRIGVRRRQEIDAEFPETPGSSKLQVSSIGIPFQYCADCLTTLLSNSQFDPRFSVTTYRGRALCFDHFKTEREL